MLEYAALSSALTIAYITPIMFPQLGKTLVIFGVVIVAIGLVLWLAPKVPFLGRLPGDLTIKKDNLTIYFPIVTMVVVSILLTIILNLFRK